MNSYEYHIILYCKSFVDIFVLSISGECVQPALRVQSSGIVYWSQGCTKEIQCHVDVSHFPFDQHQCTFRMATWAYDNRSVSLSSVGINHSPVAFTVICDPLKFSKGFTLTLPFSFSRSYKLLFFNWEKIKKKLPKRCK